MEDKRDMEDVLRRSERRAAAAGEEPRVDSVGDDHHKEDIAVKIGEKRLCNENNDMNQSSAKQKHLSCSKQELVLSNTKVSSFGHDSIPSSSIKTKQGDQLETARAEMGDARQENQRLKIHLDRVMKDYQTLQMQFVNIVQQEAKKSTETSNDVQEIGEPELVSLSLRRFLSDPKTDEKKYKTACLVKDDEQVQEGLSLSLGCKFEAFKSDANDSLTDPSSTQSLDEPKEEAGETWPPNTGHNKTTRSGDDEILQQSQVKKARVSVRARCDTPTMNDGCQWRKYGQKIAKGNPCPRAYYRCTTVAPSCPVRKQVQRCAEDMSILITTYEGTHNHPLPVSATAMASTTSAAASMLLSGSSSSSHPGPSAPSTATIAPNNLHGLNFYLSENSKSRQFYAPNSSSLTTSPLQPTITLDLTTPPPSSSSSHFSRFGSNYPQGTRYSTNLNSSSSESSSIMSWANGLLSSGSATQPYIKNNQIGSLNIGSQPIDNIYQSYMQKNNLDLPQQSLPADTIAAATKAITADPSFHSALTAALKSIIGNGNGSVTGGGAIQVSGDNFGKKLKWGDQIPVASNYSETVKGSGCASSCLNKSSSTSSDQPGSLIFVPLNSLQFSTSKRTSESSGDDKEHIE